MKTSSTINAQCLKWTSNKVKGSNRFWDKGDKTIDKATFRPTNNNKKL